MVWVCLALAIILMLVAFRWLLYGAILLGVVIWRAATKGSIAEKRAQGLIPGQPS